MLEHPSQSFVENCQAAWWAASREYLYYSVAPVVRYFVSVLVSVIFQIDGLLGVVSAEQIHMLVLVAGRNEALERQFFEVEREIVEEAANTRIIAVAVHHLALEVLLVVLEFFLDVGQLGVEFVFL